jgi:hypothetical protein
MSQMNLKSTGPSDPSSYHTSSIKEQPAPGNEARTFWTVTVVITLGLIALFGIVAVGSALLLG